MVAPDLTLILICYLVIVNLMTLGVSGFDKLAAMHFWRRTPEWVLLWLSIMGGAPTAKIMQIVAGHKTLREDFTLNLNLIAVFHLTLGVAAWSATSPLLERLELYRLHKRHRPNRSQMYRMCHVASVPVVKHLVEAGFVGKLRLLKKQI